MRTSAISAFVLLAVFILPTFASAGSTPPNGVCFNDIDCMTGYHCDYAAGLAVNKTCLSAGVPNTNTTVTSPPTTVAPTTVTSPPTTGTGQNVTLINPLKSGTSLTSFLNNILDFVINIGSIIVILMLVFVGFKFVVAQGNDSKITEARTMLLWTIIGALVLLGAKAISAGIMATVQAL